MMLGIGELLIGLLVLFLLVLVIVGVATVIWFAVQRAGGAVAGQRPERGPEEDALEILRWGYARGEITREEFTEMREDIMS